MTVSYAQHEQPDGIQEDERLQALQEENRLLFDQLQVVQEALECLGNQGQLPLDTVPLNSATTTSVHSVPLIGRLVEALAENLRYRELVSAQSQLHALQTRHALANQLGNILIEASHSLGGMLSVPRSLYRAWRQNRQGAAPKSLGGKRFERVLEAYREGGVASVEALLTREPVSLSIQASAWTELARSQLHFDPILQQGRHAVLMSLSHSRFGRSGWRFACMKPASCLRPKHCWRSCPPTSNSASRRRVNLPACRMEQSSIAWIELGRCVSLTITEHRFRFCWIERGNQKDTCLISIFLTGN